MRNEYLLEAENSALLIIDLQEKLLKAISNQSIVLINSKKLIKAAQILEMPIYYTEQYPEGLGETVEILKDDLQTAMKFRKMSFSAVQQKGILNAFEERNIEQIVIAGVEAHICVLQTVFDLIAKNYAVFVVADAIGSRKEFDFQIALQRMQNMGAEIITTEMFLFEALKTAESSKFKEISKLAKET